MKRFRYPHATAIFLLLGLLLSFNSFAQPANDECSAAITLTSSTSCVNTAGTNVNATYNPSTFPGVTIGCGASNKSDVWYRFVAQTTTQTITVSSAPSQVRVQLLSGTCGSFTSLACGNASITYTALTIGSTYYIRVYTQNSNTGTFNICVTYSPPANDDCAAAVSLSSNTSCVNTAGTLNLATANGATALGCFGPGTYYDVWYSFIAANTTETITISSLGANIINPQVQLYGGTCAALTNLTACGTTSITKSGLTVGTTYYVRVANLNANPSGAGAVANFNICVTHTPPANDDCSGAISLTSGTTCVNTAGTLVGASYTTISSIGCGVANRNDAWYSFVAVTSNPTITLSSAPANPRIQLFSGTCGSLTSIACGTSSLAATGLTVGANYYIRIYTDPNTISASNTFNICVTHAPPANDNCAGAISLTSYTACSNTAGTLNLATANGTTPLGCFGAGTYYDVWYTFVGNGLSQTVTLSSLGANITSSQIQLYSGTCAALTSLACGATSVTFITTNATTYYVRVANLNTDPSGTASGFNICLTHPGLANDQCQGATLITSNTACVNTAGTLVGSSYTGGFTDCGGYANPDVWYSFVAQSPIPTITVTSASNRIQVELFSGTCGGLTCLTGSSGNNVTKVLNPTNLTIGQTYYVRVTTSTGVTPTFNLCIQDPVVSSPPANDVCSGAITLTPGSSCVNIAGTLAGATISSPSVSSPCSSTPGADVWYSFTATSAFPTITLSSIGASISSTYIQLYSGTCGSLTSIDCGSGTSLIPGGGIGLTIGATYYVRVYSPDTYTGGTGWGFNICITNPSTSSTANINYSKSYINVTKLTTGGGVEPGDILEIRATFVVLGGTVDSVAFYDTLQNNSGFTLLSSTIATQTNEGKIYNAFTDASGDDAGWYGVNGSDTTIQINIGSGSSSTKRGAIAFLDRPRVYSSATIIMATYRVQVYATYDQKINWGGGAFTYKDGSNGMKLLSFKNDSLVVYVSPGLCSSSLSANNQVGIETNGTFGAPSSGTPLARNRGTSAAVLSYIYRIFGTGIGPNDYYYGVANNTSGEYSTLNTWAKPDNSAPTHRIFNLWDIIGDHTGAANTAKGNPPCDTTKAVSPTNPCGYMLVVNAAYKTDTAFRSNITSLCPNTYYELSAWVRNICYRCGCDSAGRGSGTAGYIPFATNDSSGVPPNLAFQINGQDYYQTGNIYYTGTGPGITQQASDSMNTWVKRGFVYKTGPTQTSFEFLIRNNAPGGGGNDWAIDDIVVATCSPNVNVTPGPNPFVCDSNTIDMGAIISSYFDTYTYYTWEKSIDNGVTWASTGVSGGPGTPTFSGGSWNYSVAYPTFIAYGADSGSMYRVMAASTVGNLSNSSCRFSGGATIALQVDPCNFILDLDILSFKGKNDNSIASLYWTTSKEDGPIRYEVQKSKEGGRFVTIGEVTGFNNPSSETNHYTFNDPEALDNTISWYRIKAIKTQDNKYKYSKVIQLIGDRAGLQIESLVNPFISHVRFDVISGDDGLIQVEILDQYQHKLKIGNYNVAKGRNKIDIANTDNLPAGFYILRVISGNNIISRKIIKRG
jgi:trimeric autotransporter adhesin